MTDNLRKIRQSLKAFSKRCREIRYSEALLYSFLITGSMAFSATDSKLMYDSSLNELNQSLIVSVSNIKHNIKKKKKSLEDMVTESYLELIQLTEQGDQVVKSPWSSWQIGANTFFTESAGTFQGRGDKSEKYPFSGIYSRGNWSETSALSSRKSSLGNSSLLYSSSTVGSLNYGLTGLLHVQEPEVEIQIMANVRPKSVFKEEISITPTITMPKAVVKPEIKPNVNKPIEATEIVFPQVEPVEISVTPPTNPSEPKLANAPTITINLPTPKINVGKNEPSLSMNIAPDTPTILLSINPPIVTKVEAIKVTAPSAITLNPVQLTSVTAPNLSISTGGLSAESSWAFHSSSNNKFSTANMTGITSNTINITDSKKFVSTWGNVFNLGDVNLNVNVNVGNTRAFMIDEGVTETTTNYKPFNYTGTINLNKSKNVGLDLQGTHTKYENGVNNANKYATMAGVANVKVTNSGTINGNGDGAGTIKNQVAFGFNNYDKSSNNTRTEMYNNGTINMNAMESAGIQIRPENSGFADNQEQYSPKRGLNMMAGINAKSITINGAKSFGILSMKNPVATSYTYTFKPSTVAGSITISSVTSTSGTAETGLTNTSTITTKVEAGGKVASYADKTYESKLENTGTGTIDITGDESIGMGLLTGMQGAYSSGTINIGSTSAISQNLDANTKSNAALVENAIGVYSEVAMTPVKAGEVDDFGIFNGTGKTIGSESVEVSGAVNLHENASKSTGLRIKDKGSITLKNKGSVNLKASDNTNYGVVVDGKNYDRIANETAAAGGTVTPRTEKLVGRVDIEKGAAINVESKDSIGYVLLQGEGTNAGTITVNSESSLGFYGNKGIFENSGIIVTTGTNSNAVVLQNNGIAGPTATQTLTFYNRDGKIKATEEGTVGIYAESGSTFTHEGSAAKITAGNGAIGIYTKGTGTIGTISSEIEVTGSTTNKTGIAIYSDGNSKTTFTSYTPSGSTPPLASDPKLTLGEGTVGLYSEDASKFESTFVINKLEANIGDKAAFAYFGGNGKTATITGSTLNNLTVMKMGEQSTLFYGDAGTIVEIKENVNTTTKFSKVSDTAQLLVTNAGIANVETGKTINSNMKTTISGLGGATVNNKGTIALSGKAGALGVYLGVYLDASTINNDGKITAAENASVAIYGEKNSTLLNNSEIETTGASSVGMFANNSNVTNKTGTSQITTNGAASAGIYGANNSVISNEGLITTKNNDSAGIFADTSNAENTGTITNEKGGSAGIYATTSVAKDISNKGTINVGTSGTSEVKGAGIYAELAAGGAGVLNISNEGDINVEIQNSVGVYAKNGTAAKADVVVTNSKNITSDGDETVGILAETATVTNAATTGKIELNGTGSVGIFGKSNSEITNDGKILSLNTSATSASVGILSDSGSAKNTGEITIDGGASAGIYTKNTNSTNTGDINITGDSSAGMYAKNSGTENFNIVNEGNIELTTTGTAKQSVGMYAHLVAGTTGTTKLENSNTTGKIKINQENSVGMYVKNESDLNTLGKAENSGEIEANKKNGVGIFVEKATGTNTSTGKITLAESGSAGIYGKADSVIENLGEITVKKDSSAGMYALNSESKNSSTISVEEGESAGMYAKLTSDAIKDYASTNTGTINLTANGTKKKSAGMYGEIEAGATKKLTLSNENDINIGIEESVGILSINNTGVQNLVVSNSGSINGTKDSSVGISAEKSTVTNTGNIVMTGLSSAGIYGKKNSEITNNNVISISGDTSAGIYLEDSDAVNSAGAKITVDKKGSSGIYGKYTDSVAHEIINEGEVTLTAASGETKSAGIYGQLEATSTGNLTINNKGTVEVGMEESVGIYTKKISGAAGTLTAENNKDVNVKSNKSVGIFADNSNGVNNKNITVDGQEATGIFGTEGATITNATGGTIVLNSTANKSSGMFATKAGTTGVNEGTIQLKATETNGMVATAGSKVTNKNTITGETSKVIGMYGTDSGTNVVNEKTITLKGDDSTAIFTKDDAKGLNETTGIIDINSKKSVGMFGLSSAASKKIDLENKGTINVNKETSTGIFASNSGALADSVIKNAGTINLKDTKTVGIYTPNSTISKVGTVNFDTNANSSVAVYLSDGAKADASTGIINLNNNSQNKVAYYIKDNGELEGANIGTVKGYGVGVYLDNANLAATTPTLDYTTNGNSGDGLIGLLMKGTNANIASYLKGIKVGATTGTNYAIGIYADGQGTTGTSGVAKGIAANITAGANGVGLFAENGSNITYSGTMKIGDGTTAGTGIYVGNSGSNASKVTIAPTAYITLNGTNGVGAIVDENATLDFNSGATIEFKGDGVGIYGKKGADITDGGGTLITNGHSVERIRVTEGKAIFFSNVLTETGNILSHVINGETIVNSGVTISAKPNSKNIVGLMADGIKNESMTSWKGTAGNEAENHGIIDLSNAETSTAMYLDSSEGLNDGKIIMGDKSTAIYGIYKNTTPLYSGAPAGTKNIGSITTTGSSQITVGDESSAIYSIGFDKVENNGAITGGDKSVGIYAKNAATDGYKPVNVTNSGNITLGKGAAGIYVSPDMSTPSASTVTNSGNITVGDSILDSAGNAVTTSVGMSVSNRTVLTTTGNITVGNKGFALFGSNNSTINVNGGSYSFANSGSLAYLERNTVLNYNNSGTLTTSSEPMLYIIDSTANMSGNDINVLPSGTGIYMTGTSSFNGWNNILLGSGSTGIYVDNSTAVLNGSKITGTASGGKGVVAVNSDITNYADMELSADDSIGIFSRNSSSSTKSIVNNGDLNIKGKRSIAAYLEGTAAQTFKNTGTINVEETSATDKNDSTVGIYATNGAKFDILNESTVNVGKASLGIYSLSQSGNVTTTATSVINVEDKAIGIYKKGGTVELGGKVNVDSHTAPELNSEPVGLYGTGGIKVTDTTSSFNVGDKSYGVILSAPGTGVNTYSNSASSNISLGRDSTFIFAEGASKVHNNASINSGTNGGIIAIYGKDGAKITNSGIIDLSQGIGNQGILVTGADSSAENMAKGVIKVGEADKSDPNNIIYGIGMAAINGASIVNNGNIYISGNSSIGMYGDGRNTTLLNNENIYLDASSATSSDKIQTMMGVFVNNGATFINEGDIKTLHSYSGNDNVQGLVGVAVLNGSTLINNGTIEIDARDSYGVLIKGTETNKSVIKNYGNITIRGLRSYGVRYDANTNGTQGGLPIGTDAVSSAVLPALNDGTQGSISSSDGANDYYAPKDPSKTVGGAGIVTMPDGTLAIQRDGVTVPESELTVIGHTLDNVNYAFSNFGVYVDTLGRTKPINVDGATSLGINSDLIIGTEFSVLTNSKNVVISNQILQPFLNQINSGIFNFTPYSGSLTWLATPEVNPVTQQITRVLMTKIPYTAFVSSRSNEFNFTDGLEQRYGIEALGSREKLLFDKINSIGNSEEALLVQAFDEMMGHQYANTQQRIYSTGSMLNKEFDYLKKEWSTVSKDSNKIKIFGMKDEYRTDTAGIIDYKSDAYGVAYLHEQETLKLGNTTGWYAGAVHNRLKFKDIGSSSEEISMIKLGTFKSTAFDDNNSLNWTVYGEGFAARNSMHRKYLVVDEIFEAKSDYSTYGAAVKNEISKEFRTSERISVKAYGSLKLEYARTENIKEKEGEMRLEVKSNDYYSINPELGIEFKFRQPFAKKSTFTSTLGLRYENELGKVADAGNKARVAYTSADWFDIRGEKEDRKGNFRADLNIGIENQRVGITFNGGYDTRNSSFSGGIGIRAIY